MIEFEPQIWFFARIGYQRSGSCRRRLLTAVLRVGTLVLGPCCYACTEDKVRPLYEYAIDFIFIQC